MRKSQRRRSLGSGDVIDEVFQWSGVVLRDRYPTRDPSVEYISLIDDESDSENGEMHASREITNETLIANVEVASLNGETAGAMRSAKMNSDVYGK